MYILDDICYAGEMQDGIKVTEAKPLRGGMMLVMFSTGEKRLFDTTLLQGLHLHRLRTKRYSVIRFYFMVSLHGTTEK